jgi:zinc protease
VTAPRADAEVFAAFKAQLSEQVARRLADPQTVFWDRWRSLYFRDHPRRRPPDQALVDRIQLPAMERLYRARFADVGDMTFVFVGRVDPAKLRPLAEKYLGALPSRGRKEKWRDVGARPKGNGKRFEMQGGVEPKALVAMAYTTPDRWSRERQHRMDSLSEALSIRLREVLREDMGGTYTIGVDGDLIRWPVTFGRANVNFTCAPDNVGKLSDAVAAEILAAKTKGFEPSYLDKVKAAQRRALEEAERTNGYWLGWLTEYYRAGTDPREVLKERQLIDTLDVAALQASARRYFEDKQKMVGVLQPAAQAPSTSPPKPSPKSSWRRDEPLPPRSPRLMLPRVAKGRSLVQGGTP